MRRRNAGWRTRRLIGLLSVLCLWAQGGMSAAREPSLPPISHSAAYPESPQALFGDLYFAVQMTQVFADGKLFADAIPKAAPNEILAEYRAADPESPVALKAFVENHFILPSAAGAPTGIAEHATITQHIDGLWDILTRTTREAPAYGSLLPLPQPYVVPGGRFREIYYWDSYFTMLGLKESNRQDLVQSMVSDFAYLIDTYGHVPNGTRSYYLSRSQPPFFFAMVGLLDDDQPAAFARYLRQLKREYAFWMDGARGLKRGEAHRRVVVLPDGSILNRYWDDRDTPRDESYREDIELAKSSGRPAPQLYRDIRAAAESGWDFGSRWFADGRTRATIDTTEILPIDLNSLMFGLENAIQMGCERQGDVACGRTFAHRAAARRAAIDRYQWSSALNAYVDYRWTQRAPIERVSAATLYPLFVGLSSATQAAAVLETAERTLVKDGGVVTTPRDTGQQWDAPNGWAPLQWLAVAGARRYNDTRLAETIACRWMFTVNSVYQQTGKLVEKYDVTRLGVKGGGGEYPTQDGFGWTNGVMRKLMALYPQVAKLTGVDQCSSP